MKMPKLKPDTPLERLWNGIVKENPTFVLMLGMCPTLAVTTGAINGLGMGLSTAAVLILSNMMISFLRHVIPDGVRMPAYIVIVASFVTVVELLMHAFVTDLYEALGIYIPLIVVNCIILGRAEAYASKHGVLASAFDGLGMGLGFTVALTLIGLVRELLGAVGSHGLMIGCTAGAGATGTVAAAGDLGSGTVGGTGRTQFILQGSKPRQYEEGTRCKDKDTCRCIHAFRNCNKC